MLGMLYAARSEETGRGQAAEAAARSGLGSLPWDSRLLVSSWWVTGDGGFGQNPAMLATAFEENVDGGRQAHDEFEADMIRRLPAATGAVP